MTIRLATIFHWLSNVSRTDKLDLDRIVFTIASPQSIIPGGGKGRWYLFAHPFLPLCFVALTIRIVFASIGRGENCVYRTKANCLKVCEQGPIAVVFPGGVWYHSVTPEVVERTVDILQVVRKGEVYFSSLDPSLLLP